MRTLLAFFGAVVGRIVRDLTGTVGPTGRFVLAIAVFALVLWGTLGWAEFGFLGLTLLAALVAALPWVLGRSTYEVTLALSPRRVSAGGWARIEVDVRNTSRYPLRPVRMEVGMTDRDALPIHVDRLDPLERRPAFTERLSFPRRGVVTAGPVVSIRGDELQLLRRTVPWTGLHELYVHPTTTRLRTSLAGLVHDLEGSPSQAITSSDLAFHALRPYEPGDDPRFIHWRASARASTSEVPSLMVRQFEETRRSRLMLMLATDARWYKDDDEFELAVSVAASIGRQVIAEGTELTVETESGEIDTRTENRFLDATSRIERARGRERSVRRFTADVVARVPDASVAILVSGSPMAPALHRSIESQFAADTRLFGIRCVPGWPADISMSRMRMIALPDLGSLGRLLRKVS